MTGPDYTAYALAFDPLGDAAKAVAARQAIASGQAAPVAGGQAASGDYAGAARTLFGAGDLKGGAQALGLSGAVGEATGLANRDYAGAAKAAGAAGDVAGVQTAQTTALQQFQLRHAYIQRATPVLNAAFQKNGAAGVAHAFDTLAPDLTDPAIGFTPQQVAQYKAEALQDPQGFLTQINALAQRKINYQKINDNTVQPVFEDNGQPAGDPITGTMVTPVPSGDSLAVRDATGTTVVSPGDAQPAAAPTAPAGPSDNNVGNLRPPSQSQGFQSFDSPAGGAVGLSDQLNRYGGRGLNTLNKLADVYAPKGDGANNPAQWAANVGKAAGLDPDAPIDLTNPNVRAKLIPAIAQAEGHAAAATRGMAGLAGGAPASAAPASGPTTQQIVPGVTMVTPNSGPTVRDATPEENAAQGNAQGAGQIQMIGKDKGKYTVITKGGDVNNWTPEAIDRAADRYRFTGQLDAQASRGAGDQAAVQQIINRADQKDQDEGISPTQRIARQALVNGAIKTQGELIDNISKMQSYARNANDDFDNVAQLAQAGLASGGVKTLRELQQWVKTQQGDAALGKLNVALNDATGNFNKVVLGSGTGAGAAPGSKDEREMTREELFPDTLPLGTLLGNIAQAKVGINNRVNEQGRQYQLNENIIKTGKFDPAAGAPQGAVAAPAAQPAAAPANVIRYGADGKRVQ